MCIIYKHSEISTGRTARARLGQRVTACNPNRYCQLPLPGLCHLCSHEKYSANLPHINDTTVIFRIFQIEQKVLVLQSFNSHFSDFVGRLRVFLDLEMAVQFLYEQSAPATSLFPTALRSVLRLIGRHVFYRQIFICVLIFYFTIFKFFELNQIIHLFYGFES